MLKTSTMKMSYTVVYSYRVIEESGDRTRYTHLITFDDEGNCMVTKDIIANGGAGLKESLYIDKHTLQGIGSRLVVVSPDRAVDIVASTFYPYKEEENIWTVTSAIRCAYNVWKGNQ